MTPKRRRELDENPFLPLTYEEYQAGFHYCPASHNELVGPFDILSRLDEERQERCWCIPTEAELKDLI